MTRVPIKLTVTNDFSVSKFTKSLFKILSKDTKRKMEMAARDAQRRIQREVRSMLQNTETVNALINGPLDAHFGFYRGTAQEYADSVIDAVVRSIKTEPAGAIESRSVLGGINIFMLESDYKNLLSLSDAYVMTEKGQRLPWLKSLLLDGNKIIISGYEIRFLRGAAGNTERGFDIVGRAGGKSRSGKAIMVENPKREQFGNRWKIPAEYAGTADNNWLTRSLTFPPFVEFLENIVKEEINKQFR